METIAVAVNGPKLIEVLRYAFTDRYTVLKELMQNARRAKASFVAIDYDAAAHTLCVRDDGSGIGDWQMLFTVGESGWEATIARDEHAFGLGFMKSLHAARRCTVRSRDRMIAFDTTEALKQVEVEVHVVPAIAGTIARLEGVVLDDLDWRIDALASAFPIPVIYNGRTVARPLAVDSLPCVTTEVGQVFVAGLEDGKAVRATLLVLQGFVVHGDSRFDGEGNVVHLDTCRFVARPPDRDRLLDEDDVVRQVDGVLRALWRAHLQEAKATLPADAFVTRYFAAAVTWGATELLADVPLLPGHLFARIVGYPMQEGYGDARYLEALPGLVGWEELRSGALQAVMLPETAAETFPHWMFAKAKGLVVFNRRWTLADNHWIWAYVRDLEEAPAEVEIVGEEVRAPLAGQWIASDVVLCAAYRIRIGGEMAEVADEGLFWTGSDGKEELIVVPMGEMRGVAVEQCSSYVDADDHYHAAYVEADRDALATLISRLRIADPTHALRLLLEDLRLERYPSLHGHTFSVEVGRARSTHAVRLVG